MQLVLLCDAVLEEECLEVDVDKFYSEAALGITS